MSEDEIFNGKTLSDLFEDIYDNTRRKRDQLDELLKSLIPYLKNVSDIEVIGPLVKDLMEVKVKNDESLIKMGQIAQRTMKDVSSANTDKFLISEEEKEQLLKNISSQVEDLAAETQDVLNNLDK